MSVDSVRIKQIASQLKEFNDRAVKLMNDLEVIRDRRIDLEISKDTITQLTTAIDDMKAASDMLDVVEINLHAIKS